MIDGEGVLPCSRAARQTCSAISKSSSDNSTSISWRSPVQSVDLRVLFPPPEFPGGQGLLRPPARTGAVRRSRGPGGTPALRTALLAPNRTRRRHPFLVAGTGQEMLAASDSTGLSVRFEAFVPSHGDFPTEKGHAWAPPVRSGHPTSAGACSRLHSREPRRPAILKTPIASPAGAPLRLRLGHVSHCGSRAAHRFLEGNCGVLRTR